MSLAPGEYKILLDKISTATNEIVTRKKLSEQSRGAASATAAALWELLSAEPKLAAVKRQLDQARSTLSRPSPGLDEACTMVDAAQTRASTGSKKKTSKEQSSTTKTTAPTAATSGEKVAGKRTSKKSAVATKKRTSSKKVAVG